MKFIKTVGGGYINAARVTKFYVLDETVYLNNTDEDCVIVAENFETDKEAQKWLDELIDELESEED